MTTDPLLSCCGSLVSSLSTIAPAPTSAFSPILTSPDTIAPGLTDAEIGRIVSCPIVAFG